MQELVKWCEEEIANMRQNITLMLDGTLKTITFDGEKELDSTPSWIAEYETRIAELETIIQRYNAA